MSGAPDLRPPRRIVEDDLGWEQLRRAKLAPCRCCGATFLPTLHHLVPRSQGGDDLPANLVPVCAGPWTNDCHGKIKAWDIGTRHRLRETLTKAEVFYVVSKKSSEYLAHAYPEAVTYCAARGKVERVIAGLCECGEPAQARSFASSYEDVDESGGAARSGT